MVGWHPPQTALHIHIRHVQSGWGIVMLSQGHMGAPLYRYTGQVVPRFWILGSLVEWKWCHFIIVEAHTHLRLRPISIRHIQSVWAIGMVSHRCMGSALYHYTGNVGPKCSKCGSFVECQWWYCMILRLTSTSDRPHPYVWGIGMLSQWHIGAPLYGSTGQVDPRFWSFGSLVEWKWCNYIMVEAHIHLRLISTSILDIYKVLEPLICFLKGIWVYPYTVTQANLAWDFWFFVTCEVEMMPLHHGWGWYPPQTTPTFILDIYKASEVLFCCLKSMWVHPYIITEDGWPQILEF